ncbi:RNA polymerase sigma factor [Edaphobacter albus]|uniref:RNA polymerase sigma factor n=1 Tax=Edaphobacter sp. 4G125 TaxID=2763071 RepID=UPI00164928DC|nr:sigma-70 family RNA polymerase sigma factor [Edaphobacter sp. 4G125]QNI36887.1 sigma-70 family RNA polymerase sigma factor [Edaphobacter sp. 4G125]
MASFEESLVLLSSIKSAESEIDLAALVETYSSLLYRVAYSILRSHTDAEDVVQESFLRVLQHRGTLPVIRDMRIWLTRIAWNLAIDRRRATRTTQIDEAFAESLVAANLPADQALDESRRMKTVLDEIERLPLAERHVLLLSSLEELSTPEIATVLERTESAVRALLFRARTRLRQRLEKGGSR